MFEDRELPKPGGLRKVGVGRKPKPKVGPARQKSSGSHGSKVKGSETGDLIAKLRKPMAPPTRVAEDERKYSRARMRERSRRESGETK